MAMFYNKKSIKQINELFKTINKFNRLQKYDELLEILYDDAVYYSSVTEKEKFVKINRSKDVDDASIRILRILEGMTDDELLETIMFHRRRDVFFSMAAKFVFNERHPDNRIKIHIPYKKVR